MLDCPALLTLDCDPCQECGRSHRFRVVASTDVDTAVRPLCGFFSTCPATGQRAWFVIRLPADQPVRFVDAGPPDDDRWRPASVPAWAGQVRSGPPR